jgi:CubicO group peptidase (beta-lactamase class C family)
MKRKIFTILITCCIIHNSFSQVLVAGSPESVGMSAERIKRIDGHLQDQLTKKWIPGTVAMVARKGKIVYSSAVGTSGIGTQDMKKDDIFRLASMTKPIVTTALMILIEEGKCLLEDPVSKYIPEFKNPVVLKELNVKDSTFTTEPSPTEITIRHLLTHTSGIGYGFTNPKISGVIYGKAKLVDGSTIELLRLAKK